MCGVGGLGGCCSRNLAKFLDMWRGRQHVGEPGGSVAIDKIEFKQSAFDERYSLGAIE